MNEDEIYHWAVRNGILSPYDFSVTVEADEEAELPEIGKRWNVARLKEELKNLRESHDEIGERMTFIVDQITRLS